MRKTGDLYKENVYICNTQEYVHVYHIAYFPFHSFFRSVPFSVPRFFFSSFKNVFRIVMNNVLEMFVNTFSQMFNETCIETLFKPFITRFLTIFKNVFRLVMNNVLEMFVNTFSQMFHET